MTQLKIVSAALLLSAAIATPVFAQDAAVTGPGSRYGLEPQPGPTYYRSYDEFDAPLLVPAYYHYRYGWYGYRDRSRPGGYSPSRNPAGN
jgi:hypothetical protein